MIITSNTTTENTQQNPIHIDSKWFKEIIALTGSMERAILLVDTMIYYHNRYKAFKVGNSYLYGLVYSAKDYQKNLHISYRKAMNLPKKLVENGFLEPHKKKFICNRTFYTPTKKALDNLYKIHFSGRNSSLKNEEVNFKKREPCISTKTDIKSPILESSSYKKNVQALMHSRTSASAYTQNPYKDKNKNNNHNNHNNHNSYYNLSRDYSLFGNSRLQNVKTVILGFNKLQLEEIIFEAVNIDYFTVEQSGAISTIIFYYYNNLDIVNFNRILNQSGLKKKARDFRQLVIWAYLEATRGKRIVSTNYRIEAELDSMNKGQNTGKFVINCFKNDSAFVNTQINNQVIVIFSDTTVDTIQAMIHQLQIDQKYITGNEIKKQPTVNKKTLSQKDKTIEITSKEAKLKLPQSSCLLTKSNKFYFLETLNKKGINGPVLILKTAGNIFNEYIKLGFNSLLDGIIYRLIRLSNKRSQQKLINQKLVIEINGRTSNTTSLNDMEEKTTDIQRENNKDMIADFFHKNSSFIAESLPKYIIEIKKAQKKTIEQSNNIEKETLDDLLNPFNRKLLIERLNAAGIRDKKLILDSAKEIMAEYLGITLKELIDGVMYRLVTLPSKQKKQNTINQSLLATLEDITDDQCLEITCAVRPNQSTSIQTNDISPPQRSVLMMPHVNKSILRQDWTSKAKQDFYTGNLPDSQKLALAAMIDYVKRKGVIITFKQEIYEWLYYMASNKSYHYSRAENFKHWCNIVIRQLMQRRLHKPAGFDGWRSRIEAGSLSVAA